MPGRQKQLYRRNRPSNPKPPQQKWNERFVQQNQVNNQGLQAADSDNRR